MKVSRSLFQFSILCALVQISTAAPEPETAELSFGARFNRPAALAEANAPAWLTKVEQQGGTFRDDPHCWRAEATAAKGVGRLTISLDRKKMNEDMIATILFEAGDAADIVVQLFDAQDRAVEVDLFGNLVEVGKEATTDTYVIPLRKYPTAAKIVLRRIVGDVKIFGVVLYPAVTEGEPNEEALKKLAAVLGDPLSPANPLFKGLRAIARQGDVVLRSAKPATQEPDEAAPQPPVEFFSRAVRPPANANPEPAPTNGLVGYWNFDRSDASDASGRGNHGTIQHGAKSDPGIHGRALRLRANPADARVSREVSWDSVTIQPHPDFDLKEAMTISAWVNYKTIAPIWGSQIAWFGDEQFGRDPWTLHLYPNGTLEIRTDRSVTGSPKFTVFENEIHLSPTGTPMLNQHVAIWSEKVLAPETWYFVAATIDKLSPRLSALRLYVNGEPVAEGKTSETINYPTDRMWMTIGAVDTGTWQNFDGLIDEVRVYNRALSAPELQALYRQPWR